MIRCLSALLVVILLAMPLSAQEREPYRSPGAAAMRSVVLPGWGQWSNGDGNKGMGFFALGTVGMLLATRTVGFAETPRRIEAERGLGWGLYGLSVVLGAFDAYDRASNMNRENGYDVSRVRLLDDGRTLALGVVLYGRSFGGP